MLQLRVQSNIRLTGEQPNQPGAGRGSRECRRANDRVPSCSGLHCPTDDSLPHLGGFNTAGTGCNKLQHPRIFESRRQIEYDADRQSTQEV